MRSLTIYTHHNKSSGVKGIVLCRTTSLLGIVGKSSNRSMENLHTVGAAEAAEAVAINGNRKRSAASTNTGIYRSVVDFDSEEELRRAMMIPQGGGIGGGTSTLTEEMAAMIAAIADGQPVQKVARTDKELNLLADQLDWVLPHYDFDNQTTNEETLDEEIKRLLVLKSYIVLDNRREEAFERITALATRIFDVPIAIITLIDLSRQWHVSKIGVEPLELLRKEVFCNHTILAKSNLLVVNDLTQDFRFCDLPTVKGPPFLRFYAGASLVSPEGYKLGTFCIIDKVTRPCNGFTEEQRSTLVDLADMTVKVMVDRRYQLEKERSEDPVQMIAYTAHDLMVPLTGIQLALSLLREDDAVRTTLGEHQLELLNTAASSSDLVIRICQNAVDGLHRLETGPTTAKHSSSGDVPVLAQANSSDAMTVTSSGVGASGSTQLNDLVKNLHMIVDPIPKKIPCIITLDQSAPKEIIADDLKLFRAALNLLTYGIGRTETGTVHLTIRPDESSILMFECEDSAPDIPVEQYEYLFQANHLEAENRVGLSSVASLVTSMDGEYGFRPRGIDANGSIVPDASGSRRSGSIFWFSVPLVPLGKSADFETIDQCDQEFALEQPMTDARVSGLAKSSNPSASSAGDPSMELGMLLEMGLGFETEETLASVLNCEAAIESLLPEKMDDDAVFDVDLPDEDNTLAAIMDQLVDFEPYPVDGGSAFDGDNVGGYQQGAGRRRRVLIIDDSMVVRRNLAVVVNNLGFEAAQATDGMEGLKQMQQSLFDLVFCDFSMPVLDGLSCVSQFREWEKVNRPWDRQVIVGISEHAHLNDNGEGQKAGMDMFFPKPITVKTVTDIQAGSDMVQRSEKLDEWETSQRQANVTRGLTSPVLTSLSLPPTVQSSTEVTGRIATPSSICLIAANPRATQPLDPFPQLLESKGWKVITINDGPDCLKLLQVRIWDAILIDDDLPKLSGVACITALRQWESQNRTTAVQRNVFLVCDGYVPSPSDTNSLIQPPNGCNGVLGRPIPLEDFECLLQKRQS